MKTLLTLFCFISTMQASCQEYYFNKGLINGFVAESGCQLIVNSIDANPYRLFTAIADTLGEDIFFGINYNVLSPDGDIVQSSTVFTHNEMCLLGLDEATIQTSDMGFMYAGGYKNDLAKISPSGMLEWDFDLDSVAFMDAVTQLDNGNFLGVGSSNFYRTNAYLTWVDGNGNLIDTIKQRFFYYPEDHYAELYREIFELPNGDILLTGYMLHQYVINDFDPFFQHIVDTDPVLVRLTESGELIWKRRYEGYYSEWEPSTVIDPFGDTAICCAMTVDSIHNEGQYNFNYNEYYAKMAIRKINLADGSIEQEHLYEENQLYIPLAIDFLQTTDGGYAILGNENSTQAFILKVDSLLNYEWMQTYKADPLDSINLLNEVYDFETTSDGGFIAGGWVIDGDAPLGFGDDDEGILPEIQVPWVFKTDACGYLEWNYCDVGVYETHSNKCEVRVWPNPAKEDIIVTSEKEIRSICLRDVTGKIVLQQFMTNNVLTWRMEISELSQGVYLIETQLENGVRVVERVVKE